MSVCAVILAAGEGTRLRPLTLRKPKSLCPVGNITLLDRSLARLADYGLRGPGQIAVNACHLADQVVAAVAGRAHLSVESPPPLGTSGGVAKLRDWIAGRGVLVCNADGYLADNASPGNASVDVCSADLISGWDGRTVRLLVAPATPDRVGEFGNPRRWRFAGMSLLPWETVRDLPRTASGLVSTVWRPAEANGLLELVPYHGRYIDCGTPADYLAANLLAAKLAADGDGNLVHPTATVQGRVQRSVVGASAIVHGDLTGSVVWSNGYVETGEHLCDAIRAAPDVTVRTRD
ncbi:MAG TPA: NTP transferase domain-containing protein [Micromonosporaceae bacterium]|nr:NTP transferase domain-containing protein [Micromonosporaceae bacterium]